MFGVEYQDCSKANILCDKYRYFCMDALNIAEKRERERFSDTRPIMASFFMSSYAIVVPSSTNTKNNVKLLFLFISCTFMINIIHCQGLFYPNYIVKSHFSIKLKWTCTVKFSTISVNVF